MFIFLWITLATTLYGSQYGQSFSRNMIIEVLSEKEIKSNQKLPPPKYNRIALLLLVLWSLVLPHCMSQQLSALSKHHYRLQTEGAKTEHTCDSGLQLQWSTLNYLLSLDFPRIIHCPNSHHKTYQGPIQFTVIRKPLKLGAGGQVARALDSRSKGFEFDC